MNREKLEAPFPPELVKKRKGAFGQTLSYVAGSAYIERLAEAFDGSWSFEVTEHRILEGEVLVLGKLVAGGVTKMAFGGSSITKARDTGEPISIADDMKSAATDSLKKCASLFGVGLSLYNDTRSVAPATYDSPAFDDGNGRDKGNGGNGRNRVGDRLTQKQLSAIWALARKAGYSSDEVRRRTFESFGVRPEHLLKADASALIGDLSDELGDGAVM